MKVALVGEAAPGTSGTYSAFIDFDSDQPPGSPPINASGDVAFFAFVTGSSVSEGLFVDEGGTHKAVALKGEIAPGTGGGRYQSFGLPRMNDSGDVAFFAVVSDGTINEGVFVDEGGTHRAVALVGDSAPGGGAYSGFDGFLNVAINASGHVAFDAYVTGGTASSGVFVDEGGTHRAAVLERETAPGTGGGTYLYPSVNMINSLGEVVFVSGVAGGTTPTGVFVDEGGPDRAVALVGETAPGTEGETYTETSDGAWINDSGDVAFLFGITGPSWREGIFVEVDGTDMAVALPGDPMPGTVGTYDIFCGPTINASGGVAFTSSNWDDIVDESYGGLFVDEGGTHKAVALKGEIAPGTGDGTYSGIRGRCPYWINDSGVMAFTADITGGSASQGVFKAPEPSGSLMLAAGIVFLATVGRQRMRCAKGCRERWVSEKAA